VGLAGRAVHPGVAVRTTRQVSYGVAEWESIGEAIAVTLLDMHGKNPHMRPSINVQSVLLAVAGKLDLPPQGLSAADPPALQGDGRLRPGHAMALEARLWRVLNSTVVVRDGPGLGRFVIEVFSQGQLLSVMEEVPGTPWVKLAAPNGFLGGKLNISIDEKVEAFMLTDGSQVGLGRLLQKTDLWVRVVGHPGWRPP